jgi:ribosomal protein S18 acetylase RimI-like enzyme
MPNNIRAASTKDVEAIAKIHVDSWEAAFEGLMPEQYIADFSLEKRINEWRSIIDNKKEVVLVVERSNQVIGFLSYTNNENRLPKSILLSKLYISPSVYQKGLGTLLLTQLFSTLTGYAIEQVSLYVLDSNISAINFYKKHGFEETGDAVKEDFEGQTITDIEMIKKMAAI